MKVRIRGVEYDVRRMGNAAPLHMIELQAQSKKLDPPGWRISKLRLAERESRAYTRAQLAYEELHAAWVAAGSDPDLEPVEPDEPETVWIALAMMTFLTMRAGGTKITLEDAAEIGLGEMEWIADADDQADDAGEVEADPTTPGPAEPAGPVTPDAGPPPLELPVGA